MKTLILVGGGHAHLHCLEQVKNDPVEDLHVMLISPSRHQYYSGMFSGFTEGVYSLDDIRIDLAKLSENVGCTFIEDSIVSIDAQAKNVIGVTGAIYHYDLVSFDIGSRTAIPEKLAEQVALIKPNYLFPEQLEKLRESDYPIIVGGGASGVELAFSIQAWRKQQGLLTNTALISSTPLLSSSGKPVSKKIETIAKRKSLSFYTGNAVDTITNDHVITSAKKSYRQSAVLWLTGPMSDELFNNSGVQTDEGGFLLVDSTLRSVHYPEIFGAGDCISINRYPTLAKNGVYAVRQGPVLWNNLKNGLNNSDLKPFSPQKNFVAILSTGGGQALLTFGKFTLHGAIAWKMKRYIDRKFMKRYKALY